MSAPSVEEWKSMLLRIILIGIIRKRKHGEKLTESQQYVWDILEGEK